MNISREDAEMFLRKMADERTLIGLVSEIAGVTFAVNGCVTLPGDSLTIEGTANSSGWAGGRVTIDLNSISGFDYQDAREAPEHVQTSLSEAIINSCLRLDSPEIRCCLYELQLGSGASV